MIYKILKVLFSITVRAFFRKYKVLHAERIPDSGPLLLVANHPSTFMDPIVMAMTLKRDVYFIAKGEAFRSRFAKWILPKFHVIPVYRKEHDPDKMHMNEETFHRVFEILEKGGVVLIFPEGISLTDRKLKQIKTGASRMVLGAEERNNFKLGVKIVPFGLNYSNPHKFQSTLLINVDEPIVVKEYEERYKRDSFKAAHDLTDTIRERLEKLIVLIQDDDVNELMHKIEVVYKSQILRDMGFSAKIPEHDYIVTQLINKRVHYFLEHDPERVEKMKIMIEDYFRLLNRFELNDYLVRNTSRRMPVWLRGFFTFFYLIIGFPLFLFGAINNYLPFKIPNKVAYKMSSRIEFIGAITMSVGTFTFLIFYSLQIFLAQYFFHNWVYTVGYALLLPVSGLFAFYYWRKITNLRGKWTFISLFFKQARLAGEIINRREELIAELEKGREDYEKQMASAN